MTVLRVAVIVALGLAVSSAALANETISYSYDARGRLVQVQHSGSSNNGLTTTYTHDRTGNRSNVTITGASH
jgi:YD repeat-containing protein